MILTASAAKAVMDVLQFHYETSIFSRIKNRRIMEWFNPIYSWKNKWKDGDVMKGEVFFGSSTILVWTTDAWHFFQHVMITCFMLSIVIYRPMFGIALDFVLLYVSFTGLFELLFHTIFKLRKR